METTDELLERIKNRDKKYIASLYKCYGFVGFGRKPLFWL